MVWCEVVLVPRTGEEVWPELGQADGYGWSDRAGSGLSDGYGHEDDPGGDGNGHGWSFGDEGGNGNGPGYPDGPSGFPSKYGEALNVTNEESRRTDRIFRCAGCIGGFECSIHGRRL